jgi:hypothetical protein
VNTDSFWKDLLISLGLGLLTNELSDRLPVWAEKIVYWTARKLPEHAQKRYEDDWLADLEDCRTGFSKLFFAVGLVFGIKALRVEIGKQNLLRIQDGATLSDSYSLELREYMARLKIIFATRSVAVEKIIGRKLTRGCLKSC